MTVTDKWSCPRCTATWIRDMQPLAEWEDVVRNVQSAHSPRCAQTASLR